MNIIKIYLILEWSVKFEGQTEGLVAIAGMHTYYCNMQIHDSEIIEGISTEILQSPLNCPFVIIYALQLAILDFLLYLHINFVI